MNIFRTTTNLLMATLLTGVPLHLLLLVSDSEIYRSWVYIQILLLASIVILLWFVRKYNLFASLAVVSVSLAAIYINAVYLNYGNSLFVWFIPLSTLFTYGAVTFFAHKAKLERKSG